MPRQTERIALPGHGPGTARHLLLHRYGAADARPKAYIQASTHADEVPGLLVAHHLVRMLDEADKDGAIDGRIVVAPYANPVGLAQMLNLQHVGRYDLAGGGNFNRNWPNLFATVAERVEPRLTHDAEANVAEVRAAMREAIGAMKASNQLKAQRKALSGEAYDCDIVLDLHCDDDALMHLFAIPALWPGCEDLAAELDCAAVITSDPTGGDPFDEAFSSPWTRLAERFPGHPIPPACLSVTVELRGQADVSDELARADAAALFRFLQRRGLIAGDPGPLPRLKGVVTSLNAVDSLYAPIAGVVAYRAALGSQVTKGQVVAEIVDPAAEDPARARVPVESGTDGLLLSRRLHKYVMPGESVARVVGREPLAHRTGYLMDD